MDFRFEEDVEAFRSEVRAFLDEAMSTARAHADPLDLTGLDEAFERDLHRRAGERGWLGLPPERQAVFDYEVGRADAPLIDTAMTLAGQPVGRYRPDLLPAMAAGEVEVCIAYTETGAGSDLTAVETVAEADADADGWILTGDKVLVTGAHKADWCCTIARTRLDVPARQGMSMFLVDMGAPGVTIVRRATMNGWTLDDVRFDHVRLGPGDLLGVPNDGWRQLVAAMAGERSGWFWLGSARRVLDLLIEHVRTASRDGRPLAGDGLVRDTVARLAVELAAAERLARRALATPGDPVLPSMVKVAATELLQQLAQAASELAGHAGVVWAPLFTADPPAGAAAGGRFAWEYLERVHGTISVGANELQRDAIAQLGLGLPRPGR